MLRRGRARCDLHRAVSKVDDDLKELKGVQLRIIICRRAAASTVDRKLSKRLFTIADEMERVAREVDRLLCSPK
jgi:hypothetical protein